MFRGAKKNQLDWQKKAGDLRTEANAFIKAAADKNVVNLQKSAQAINNACNACHAIYKD